MYAPNASVKINGNGDVMGAVVGRYTGNTAFHYDESLAAGASTPLRRRQVARTGLAEERSLCGTAEFLDAAPGARDGKVRRPQATTGAIQKIRRPTGAAPYASIRPLRMAKRTKSV